MTLPPLTFNAWLRYDLIRRMMRHLDGVDRILEIGGGEGAMGARFARSFDYVGVEPDARSFAIARARLDQIGRGTVVGGDLSALDHSSTFDLVCAFEVLEHIEDDRAALVEWRGLIRPGGWLILSVPAHSRRLGAWDQMVGHYRRYGRGQMSDLLTSAGFAEIVVWTCGFPLGNFLEWVRNRLARRGETRGSMAERTAASGRLVQPSDELGWLTRVVTAPFRLAQRPFVHTSLGPGLVVRARRSG